VWEEVVGRAHDNASLTSIYLAFTCSAGIIAGIGVVTGSAVLIVGAMALSPDLLPISACAIGVVERRWQLALRALRALSIGLAAGTLGAFGATVALRIFGQVPADLVLAETTAGKALTSLGPGSLMVAATAGVAGMLAFERPSGAAVGVAISVTTIPAAAYVGAAAGMGRDDPMWGGAGGAAVQRGAAHRFQHGDVALRAALAAAPVRHAGGVRWADRLISRRRGGRSRRAACGCRKLGRGR
jgi:uncharacterized hydrophobic protein (TIGR00271 family)